MKYNKTSYIKNDIDSNYTMLVEEKVVFPQNKDYFINIKKAKKYSINDGLLIDYSNDKNFFNPQHIK